MFPNRALFGGAMYMTWGGRHRAAIYIIKMYNFCYNQVINMHSKTLGESRGWLGQVSIYKKKLKKT